MVLDSGFYAVDHGWISGFLVSGTFITFGIPVVRDIPGSLSWIPDSKARDSRIP